MKASGKSTLSPLHLLDVAMNLSLLFYFILFLILFLLASIKLAVQIKLDFFFFIPCRNKQGQMCASVLVFN